MQLNDLFRECDIDPREVVVLRHRPPESELAEMLPSWVHDRPELFMAYQQTQTKAVERLYQNLEYVAAFVGLAASEAVFAGLYKIGKSKPLSVRQYWNVPAYREMMTLGMRGFTGRDRSHILWFDMQLLEFYLEWRGKLIVAWPPPERSWARRAHRNEMRVKAIVEESIFSQPLREWDKINFSWSQLALISKSQRAKLEEWRGIYYIYDVSDHKGYVGSAYGSYNLFGRWKNYAMTQHGGNKLLRGRDPKNFRFTILQLVAPTMNQVEVIALESSWKDRLHSRFPTGLNRN